MAVVVVLALPVGAGNEEAATAEAGVMGVVVAWARALSKKLVYVVFILVLITTLDPYP